MPGDCASDLADGVQALRSRDEGARRLECEVRQMRIAFRDVRGIRDDHIKTLARDRFEPPAVAKLDIQSVLDGVALRYRESRCACFHGDNPCGRAMPLDCQGDRAAPGAEIQNGRRLALQRDLDEQLGLGPRHQHRPVPRQIEAVELLVADDISYWLAALPPLRELPKPLFDVESECAF